jgi:hypothetical protein
MKFFFLSLSFFLFINALAAQKIIYVNIKNTNTQLDGNSWQTAYKNLQIALTEAQYGDSVWVASGVYYPTNDLNKDTSFTIKQGIHVFGSFSGIEKNTQQRKIKDNITILSGDIGVAKDTSDNSFNVVYIPYPDKNTVIDGFQIEYGNATSTVDLDPFDGRHKCGGGMYVNVKDTQIECFSSIKNCIFQKNSAKYGGGIFLNLRGSAGYSLNIDNCVFDTNYSNLYGSAIYGDWINSNVNNPYNITINGTSFLHNRGWLTNYGVIYFPYMSGNLSLTKCTFKYNHLQVIEINYNPAATFGLIKIDSCVMSQNDTHGPMLRMVAKKISKFELLNSIFDQNNTKSNSALPSIDIGVGVPQGNVANCIFSNNTNNDNEYSSCLDIGFGKNSKGYISNCVFYHNKYNARLYRHTDITNCIIIENEVDSLNQTIYYRGNLKNCLTNIKHIGNFPLGSCDTATMQLSTNPLFLNPFQGDFHIASCSPAINAGYNAVLDSLGITTDIEGKPRIAGARVDIGAYERQTFFDALPTIKGSCTGQQGSVAFAVQEGTAPYTYQWQQGATSGTSLSNLAQGTYQFTVSDAAGCKDSLQIVVPKATSAIQLEGILKNDIRCFGEKNGNIQLLPQGGTAPYQYVWSNNTTANPALNLKEGSYTATVTDAEGCSSVSSPILIAEPFALKIAQFDIKNATGPLKKDGYVVIQKITGGTPPYTYKWSNGVTDTLNKNLAPENYTLTVTDANGCFEVLGFGVTWQTATNELDENALLIYPNPVASEGILHLNNTIFFETITLIDVLGRIVLQEPILGRKEIELRLPSLVKGAYLLCLNGKKGEKRKMVMVE